MARRTQDILEGLSPNARVMLRWGILGAASGGVAHLVISLLSYVPNYWSLSVFIDAGILKFWLQPHLFIPGLVFGFVMGKVLARAGLLDRRLFAAYVLCCTLSFFLGDLVGQIPSPVGPVGSSFSADLLGGTAKALLLTISTAGMIPSFRRRLPIFLTIFAGIGLSIVPASLHMMLLDPRDLLRSLEVERQIRLVTLALWHGGVAAAMATVFYVGAATEPAAQGRADPDGVGPEFTRRTASVIRWAMIGLLSGALAVGLTLLTKGALFLLAAGIPARGMPDVVAMSLVFLLLVPVWPGPVFGVVVGRALIRSRFLRAERGTAYILAATLSYVAAGTVTAVLAIVTEAFQPHSRALPLVGFCGGLIGAGLLTAFSARMMSGVCRARPAILATLAGGLAGAILIRIEPASFFIALKGYALLLLWPAIYAGAMAATLPGTISSGSPPNAPPA